MKHTLLVTPLSRRRRRSAHARIQGNHVSNIMQYGLAAVGLVLLAPLCVIIGLLIKITSPGPMLCRGLHVGNNGRIFTMYKFRTMDVGTQEKIGARLLTDDDADYTGIGKFLKRTKLDALPELVNVLKGDMNLAGLRPIRPIFLEKLWDPIRRYPIRSAVKSGMVGLV